MEAPGPLAFARKKGHPIGDQTLEDDKRRSITQGGRGGNTRETEESAHPPGTNRDMGSGRGQQFCVTACVMASRCFFSCSIHVVGLVDMCCMPHDHGPWGKVLDLI